MANDIGAKIKFLRKLHGLTQEEFGDIIRYSRTAVTNFETNARALTVKGLQEVSDYFNISIVYFFEEKHTELEKDLLPYIEGNKPLNLEKLSPLKRAEIIRALYEFETKYNKDTKLLCQIPKTPHPKK